MGETLSSRMILAKPRVRISRMTDYPEPELCEEEGIVPSSLSVTIRGRFPPIPDNIPTRVSFGFLKKGVFHIDTNIKVESPTQVEYNKIRVPVRILAGALTKAEKEVGVGARYVNVTRVFDGTSENAIFLLRKGEE